MLELELEIWGVDSELFSHCAVVAAQKWGIDVLPYDYMPSLVMAKIAEKCQELGVSPQELGEEIKKVEVAVIETATEDGSFQQVEVTSGIYTDARYLIEFQQKLGRSSAILWQGTYKEYLISFHSHNGVEGNTGSTA